MKSALISITGLILIFGPLGAYLLLNRYLKHKELLNEKCNKTGADSVRTDA